VHEPQWVELEGAHNFRDLGGLPAGNSVVRPGVLFRSDGLDDLTSRDIALLLESYGIRSVVDLRGVVEAPSAPEWIVASGLTWKHVPLIDIGGPADLQLLRTELDFDVDSAYRRMLVMASAYLRDIVQFLAESGESRPAVVHCAAGKDRTGIVAAVLLATLGVDREAIIADYMATEARLQRVRAAMRAKPVYERTPERAFEMSSSSIAAVLDVLEEADGGAPGYLRQLGVADSTLAELTAAFLKRKSEA
jgi:protein-tyrosine phosphatase